MIELRNVSREYRNGGETVRALHGLSFHLRDQELVLVQGERSSGKSTLLRLLSGMESVSHGEIFYAGRSTKNFKASDWASWRSGAVGLVMGGEELLFNERVDSNVELPMRLAGMAKGVRKKRTLTLLKRVGLGEKLHLYPADLSIYEKRCLSIARALANDPDAILAEEPFQGLNGENARKLMELFATIAKDRLVVLFSQGDTPAHEGDMRTIRLMNGQLLSDSRPWQSTDSEAPARPWQKSILGLRDSIALALRAAGTRKSALLCIVLAVSLALGSLGLRLSLEGSLEKAEAEEQREALTIAPYTIDRQIINESLLLSLLEQSPMGEEHGSDGVYSASYRPALYEASGAIGQSNQLSPFANALEEQTQLYSSMSRENNSELHIYASDTTLEVRKLENTGDQRLWAELPGDGSILKDQYQVLAGRWCAQWDELVLFVNEKNEISDVAMSALGLSGGESGKRNYEDLCAVTFRLLLPTDYFQRGADGRWAELQDDNLLRNAVDEGIVLRVVGIVRPAENSKVHAFPAVLGYPASLRSTIERCVEDSAPVKEQRENPNRDIFTGLPFPDAHMRAYTNSEKAAAIREMVKNGVDIPTQMAMYCRITGCSEAEATYKVSNNVLGTELAEKLNAMGDGDCAGLYNTFVLAGYSTNSVEENLNRLGVAGGELENLRIYTSSLAQREKLLTFVENWNAKALAEGRWLELVWGYDKAESLAAVSGKHSALLLSLLTAFAVIALIGAWGMLSATLNGAVERQSATLHSLYLLGISPGERAGLLRTEGMLLGLCCSVLGFGLSVGTACLLPFISQRLWGLRLMAGVPWLAAAIALPGGVVLGLLSALPACAKAGKKR